MVIASFLTRSLILVSLGRLGSRFGTNNELRNANEYLEFENNFVNVKNDYSKLTPYDTSS